MEKNNELVKLITVKEFKEDMEIIEGYCDFVGKTLFKLSKKESIYMDDLKKCMDRVDRIRSYAVGKAKEDETLTLTSFLFDED